MSNGSIIITNTTKGGQFSVPWTTTSITKAVIVNCTDVFTGLGLPFPVSGDAADGVIQISPVTNIGAASFDRLTMLQSYAYLGLNVTSYPGNAWQNSSLSALFNVDNAPLAVQILIADIGYMGLVQVMGQHFIHASASAINATCTDYSSFVAQLSQYLANVNSTDESWYETLTTLSVLCHTPFSPSDYYTVRFMQAFMESVTGMVLSERQPFFVDVVFLARASAYLTSLDIESIRTLDLNMTQALHDINQQSVNTSSVYSFVNINDYAVATADVVARGIGPLSGAEVSFRPLHSQLKMSLGNTSFNSSVIHINSEPGVYYISAGAVDTMLTLDNETPIRTIFPHFGLVGVNATDDTTPSFNVGNINGLLFAAYKLDVSNNYFVGLPQASRVQELYEQLINSTGQIQIKLNSSSNYQTRSFPTGSSTALAVMAVDTALHALTQYGGRIIAAGVPVNDEAKVVGVCLYALCDVINI